MIKAEINEDKIKKEIREHFVKMYGNVENISAVDGIVEYFIGLFVNSIDKVIVDNIKDVLKELAIKGIKK
jgi:hypothetical protein